MGCTCAKERHAHSEKSSENNSLVQNNLDLLKRLVYSTYDDGREELSKSIYTIYLYQIRAYDRLKQIRKSLIQEAEDLGMLNSPLLKHLLSQETTVLQKTRGVLKSHLANFTPPEEQDFDAMFRHFRYILREVRQIKHTPIDQLLKQYTLPDRDVTILMSIKAVTVQSTQEFIDNLNEVNDQ